MVVDNSTPHDLTVKLYQLKTSVGLRLVLGTFSRESEKAERGKRTTGRAKERNEKKKKKK